MVYLSQLFSILLIFAFSTAKKIDKTEMEYFNPIKVNLTVPKEIFQVLEFIELLDISSLIRNPALLNDTKCNEDFLSVFTDLKNNEQWPKIYFDSQSNINAGLMKGNRIDIGNFDECLDVEPAYRNFTGQYCLMYMNDSVLPLNLSSSGLFSFRRPLFYKGICVPSTCSREYLNRLLPEIIVPTTNKTLGDLIGVGINEGDCHVKNEKVHFTTKNWVTVGLLAILATALMLSTLYDIWQHSIKRNEKANPFLRSFSLFTNAPPFFHPKKYEKSANISCLGCLKVFGAFHIIFFHTFLNMISGNPQSYDYLKLTQTGGIESIILNHAFSSVDTFLFISGVLVVFSFMSEVRRKGEYDPVASIIKRYFRLMPAFLITVLIRIGLSDQFAVEPAYNALNNYFKRNCEDNLWGMIFVYHNFLDRAENLCYYHTYYLPLDLQIFAICQVVLLLALWKPKSAAVLAFVLSWVVASVEFYIGNKYDLGPLPSMDKAGKVAELDYNYPHTRAAPWFAGMFLGFILSYHKKNSRIMSKRVLALGWLLASAIFLVCIIPIIYMTFDSYEQPWAAIYLAYRKIGWCISVSWIILVCYTGNGGIVQEFFSCGPVLFFSNISYELYLLHIPVHEYIISISRTTIHYSFSHGIYHYLAIMTYTTILAVLTSVTVTIPFCNISNECIRSVCFWPMANHCKENQPEKKTTPAPVTLYEMQEKNLKLKLEEEIPFRPGSNTMKSDLCMYVNT